MNIEWRKETVLEEPRAASLLERLPLAPASPRPLPAADVSTGCAAKVRVASRRALLTCGDWSWVGVDEYVDQREGQIGEVVGVAGWSGITADGWVLEVKFDDGKVRAYASGFLEAAPGVVTGAGR